MENFISKFLTIYAQDQGEGGSDTPQGGADQPACGPKGGRPRGGPKNGQRRGPPPQGGNSDAETLN